MAFTLGNAKTFLQDWDRNNGSTRGVRNQVKICNDANRAYHQAGKWDHARRKARLTFAAPYSTGTCAVAVDGTAVTGTGTAFAAADVGKFIRFDGEDISYEITARASTTGITIQTGGYQGSSALTVATYSITNERLALPADFRDMVNPILDQYQWKLAPADMSDVLMARQIFTTTNAPTMYAIEWAEVSSVPTPYIWVNPAPAVKHVIEYMYYAWPTEVAVDADLFKIPLQYEPVLREFMKAYLYQEQGVFDKFALQIKYANEFAAQAIRTSRSIDEQTRRIEWSPENDPCDYDGGQRLLRPAAGEPYYL